MAGLRFLENPKIETAELVDLYSSVGWVSYARNPIGLKMAMENSTFVCSALLHDNFVGLVRCLSDDVHIVYVQDILVKPEAQRMGIGRKLMGLVRKRYSHVPQLVLLTDDKARLSGFYSSLGMTDICDWAGMTAFVQIEGHGPPRH